MFSTRLLIVSAILAAAATSASAWDKHFSKGINHYTHTAGGLTVTLSCDPERLMLSSGGTIHIMRGTDYDIGDVTFSTDADQTLTLETEYGLFALDEHSTTNAAQWDQFVEMVERGNLSAITIAGAQVKFRPGAQKTDCL